MSKTDDQPIVFEIPRSQKLFPAGFALLLLALAALLMTSGGYMFYVGWVAVALALFQAIQSAVFLFRSEVCRIEDDTLIVRVGPMGPTRVDLDDILEVESEQPYLSLRARKDDEADDTRRIQIATNVLNTADRERLKRLLEP